MDSGIAMKKKWKIILIVIFLLPIVVFFPACSCNSNDNNTSKEPSYYTVRFYTNSGDTFNIPSQTVQEGELVRRPSDPTRTGYVFIGWYQDSALNIVWNFGIDTVKHDMTLYARWQPRQYN